MYLLFQEDIVEYTDDIFRAKRLKDRLIVDP